MQRYSIISKSQANFIKLALESSNISFILHSDEIKISDDELETLRKQQHNITMQLRKHWSKINQVKVRGKHTNKKIPIRYFSLTMKKIEI